MKLLRKLISVVRGRPAAGSGSPSLSASRVPEVLYFRDTVAAFSYACKYMPKPLEEGQLVIGFVHGAIDPDGQYLLPFFTYPFYDVSLATTSGMQRTYLCRSDIEAVARHWGHGVAPLQPRDLVLIDVALHHPGLPLSSPIHLFIARLRLLPQMPTATMTFAPEFSPPLLAG